VELDAFATFALIGAEELGKNRSLKQQ